MQISIIASSVRPNLWNEFYQSLLKNKVTFEVIFVGDKIPAIGEIPIADNFIYINSPVKPAQCNEIAFRAARGELIHWTADEAIYNYEKPNNLDILYDFYQSLNDKKIIAAFTTKENNGESFSITSGGHYLGDNTTQKMACFGLISRKYVLELGGFIDRRFITGQYENDLSMRVYEAGGDIKFCEDAIVAVYHNKAHSSVEGVNDTKFRKWYPQSRKFLEECWFLAPNVVSPKRLLPFEPFKDEKLRKISQEPKGEWQ